MATTTPNFGWPVPTSTDLVKNGATAMEALGDAIDTSMVDLKGGTTGQILSKASSADMDFSWTTPNPGDITSVTAGTGISGGGTSGDVTITNSMATAIDAKGDLVVGTGADAFSRLAVGTNGQVLTADSTKATGLAWATSAASAFCGTRVYRSGNQSISNTTATAVAFNAEAYDTDGFHDNATNPSRLTIPTGKGGYYQVNALIRWININATNTVRQIRLYINGVSSVIYSLQWVQNDDAYQSYCDILSLNAGDYIEFYVWQNSGSSTSVLDLSTFSIAKIG